MTQQWHHIDGIQVITDAVTPARGAGTDGFLTETASVSEVEVTRDLGVAKIYVTVEGDQMEKDMALANLKHLQGYVRTKVASSMNLRKAPEIRFLYDERYDQHEQVCALQYMHKFMCLCMQGVWIVKPSALL